MSRQVKITIGDEEDGANKEKQKEVPIWISQSTVGRSEGGEDVPAAVAQSVALESIAASDDDDDGEDEDIPEDIITLDLASSVHPVKFMQALQANIKAMEAHAAQIF